MKQQRYDDAGDREPFVAPPMRTNLRVQSAAAAITPILPDRRATGQIAQLSSPRSVSASVTRPAGSLATISVTPLLSEKAPRGYRIASDEPRRLSDLIATSITG